MKRLMIACLLAASLLPSHLMAQMNTDPGITALSVMPAHPAGVGDGVQVFATIENKGTEAILGDELNNQMEMTLSLGKLVPDPAAGDPLQAVSGSLMSYFTVSFNAGFSQYYFLQKLGTSIPTGVSLTLSIATVVSQSTTNYSIPDIGASMNIIPNPSSEGSEADDYQEQFVSSQVTLPLAGIGLKGSMSVGGVELSWTAATGDNGGHFEIQRSFDGASFAIIGAVAFKNTGGLQQAYGFNDSHAGMLAYYRISMVDKGKVTQSNMVVLRLTNGLGISMFPNPASEFTMLAGLPDNVNVLLYDNVGKKLREIKAVTGKQRLDLRRMASGSYRVLVTDTWGKPLQANLLVKDSNIGL